MSSASSDTDEVKICARYSNMKELNKKKIQLEIPFEVTSASRPRVTRYGTFYSKNYEAFRKVVGEWLDKQKIIKLNGALSFKVIFLMPIPKSWSNKKKEASKETYCISHKDIDNMQKAIFDVLQGKAFDDDCQIAHIEATKMWTAGPGHISITIEELG
jgi:Holliday junction resolvase RusA-like endonuclease